jgi:1-deoxy-D-xylulose-5-phosphate reductoisomerase
MGELGEYPTTWDDVFVSDEASLPPTTRRRDVVVLGSTGSIGTQALDVVRANPKRFRIVGLATSGSHPALLASQALEFRVPVVAIPDQDQAVAVAEQVEQSARHAGAQRPQVLAGPEAVAELVTTQCHVVLNAISGAAGLDATLATLDSGHQLALANKESLIIGGELVVGRAKPGQIVPVDSEHCALAQCLRAGRREDVRRLVITASGGPFRGRTRADLAAVTATDALAHPTWSMGPLITTNSATLVNKGLEVIEAHLLFDIGFDQIEVVVHPQSIVHSMVEYVDGSTIAQVSPPDMRLAIAYALADGGRVPDAAPAMDWTAASRWTFEPVDHTTFPAITLAVEAGRRGGVWPAVYNGVNEAMVAGFLAGRTSFLDIADTIAAVMHGEDVPSKQEPLTRDDVVGADAWARQQINKLLDDRETRTASEELGT